MHPEVSQTHHACTVSTRCWKASRARKFRKTETMRRRLKYFITGKRNESSASILTASDKNCAGDGGGGDDLGVECMIIDHFTLLPSHWLSAVIDQAESLPTRTPSLLCSVLHFSFPPSLLICLLILSRVLSQSSAFTIDSRLHRNYVILATNITHISVTWSRRRTRFAVPLQHVTVSPSGLNLIQVTNRCNDARFQFDVLFSSD